MSLIDLSTLIESQAGRATTLGQMVRPPQKDLGVLLRKLSLLPTRKGTRMLKIRLL